MGARPEKQTNKQKNLKVKTKTKKSEEITAQ